MNNGKVALAVLGFAAATVFTTVAAAQDARFYVGGAIGQTKAEGDCPSGATCDLKDNGWKIFGGYKFNPNFAVEGSYGNFGEITLNTGAVTAKGELTSWGIAAVGMLPIGTQFSLFGKLGLNLTKQKVTVSGPGGSALERDDGSELNFGFGALFHAMPQLGLRLEWERLEKSEVDMISIGVQYRF
jgi:OmpA-OmpF porin, OOP family